MKKFFISILFLVLFFSPTVVFGQTASEFVTEYKRTTKKDGTNVPLEVSITNIDYKIISPESIKITGKVVMKSDGNAEVTAKDLEKIYFITRFFGNSSAIGRYNLKKEYFTKGVPKYDGVAKDFEFTASRIASGGKLNDPNITKLDICITYQGSNFQCKDVANSAGLSLYPETITLSKHTSATQSRIPDYFAVDDKNVYFRLRVLFASKRIDSSVTIGAQDFKYSVYRMDANNKKIFIRDSVQISVSNLKFNQANNLAWQVPFAEFNKNDKYYVSISYYKNNNDRVAGRLTEQSSGPFIPSDLIPVTYSVGSLNQVANIAGPFSTTFNSEVEFTIKHSTKTGRYTEGSPRLSIIQQTPLLPLNLSPASTVSLEYNKSSTVNFRILKNSNLTASSYKIQPLLVNSSGQVLPGSRGNIYTITKQSDGTYKIGEEKDYIDEIPGEDAPKIPETPGDGNNENPGGVTPGTTGGKVTFKNPLKPELNSISAIVEALIRGVVLPIAIPILAMAIIYTGFLFVQARGKPEKLTAAKEALKYTIIGGLVILGSYLIANALQATLVEIIGVIKNNWYA